MDSDDSSVSDKDPQSPSSVTSSRPDTPQSPAGPHSPSSSEDESRPITPKSPEEENNSSRSNSPSPSDNEDNQSVKSGSSRSSNKSNDSSANKVNNEEHSSDSSASSVDSSSRKNKNITKSADTQPEEISDGDMESDGDSVKDEEVAEEEVAAPELQRKEINISHEDLSDVSDLEDSIGDPSDVEEEEEEGEKNDHIENDVESKAEVLNKSSDSETKKVVEKPARAEEVEEPLDFEAEDGECAESEPPVKEPEDKKAALVETEEGEEPPDEGEEEKEPEELEEGEVTDEDDARPEETEPRPVCRFFSRGQCTWGASCRFLHPGVTDKGNYTMFELIRPVVPGEFTRDDRAFGKGDAPQVESAWERGLRTAKEMLRKSIKRKEQDIDFEEKKMNLSLAQEEFDKENGYYGRVSSPEPRYVRHIPPEYPVPIPVARPPHPEEYYARRQVVYEAEYVPPPPPPRERVRSYRELPSHRMPDFYNNKYEEEPQPVVVAKVRRPKREVIVQRVEEKQGRGDEWSDPWMRSKSPGRRKEGMPLPPVPSGAVRKRSYSSGSSYSSSSSSKTSTESSRSTYRSRSRSSHRRGRSRTRKGRHVSPSVIVSERKAANERAALMNPPAPRKRAASPGMMRVNAANPPAPAKEDQFGRTRNKLAVAAAIAARVKGHRKSRTSSDSSGSSSSDSDSSGSSSTTSREGSSPPRRGVDISLAKAMDALKGSSAEKRQIKLNLKNPSSMRKAEVSDVSRKVEAAQGKKRAAASPPSSDSKSKKATSRREELLKQLKAVEDAIAKKRSKAN